MTDAVTAELARLRRLLEQSDWTDAEVAFIDAKLLPLLAVAEAAQTLMENSPIGDDDRPYASEIVGKEFNALYDALAALAAATDARLRP